MENTANTPDLTTRLQQFLETNGVNFTFLRHEPTVTSEDSSRIRGTPLEQGAKAMVFSADGKPVLLVLQASKRIDTKTFKQASGIRNLKLILPEELKELTGLEVGSVPPFGNLMALTTYVDVQLLEMPVISFNAGSRTASVIMSPQDYARLCQPIVSNFARD